MTHSALRWLLLAGVAVLPWGCSDSEGLVLPDADASAPPSTPDAEAPETDAEAPEADAAIDASDEDAAPSGPSCSVGGFCRTELPTNEVLHSVWGTEDGSVWAGGTRSIFQWDGTQWKTAFSWPDSGVGARAKVLVGSGPEDVWAFGDGADRTDETPSIARLARRGSQLAWREVTSDIEIRFGTAGDKAWAAGPSDIWLGWSSHGLWRIRGEDESGHAAATRELLDAQGRPLTAYSVWGFGLDHVFASAPGTVLRRTSDGTWVDAVDRASLGPYAISLFGPVAGDPHLWLSAVLSMSVRSVSADGELSEPELERSNTDQPPCIPSVASVVRKDLAWLSNGRTVCRYDGSSFELVPITIGTYPSFTVRGVWSNGTDTWIVGEERPHLSVGHSPVGSPRGFALRHKGGS